MIGIVVLSFNDAKYALECVKSIEINTEEKVVLVVVNNGCNKENTDILNMIKFPAKFIHLEENVGLPKGYNIGMKYVFENGCEYVILLNADTIVKTKEWIGNMKCVFEKHSDAGMVGAMTNHISSKHQNIVRCGNKLPNKHIKSRWLGLGLTMIPKKVVDEVGYLDENMGYGGCVDREYSLRLRLAGYNLYVDGYTFIFHYEGSQGFKNLSIPYKQLRKQNIRYIRSKYPEHWRMI